MIRALVQVGLLIALYVLVLGSAQPGDLAVGAAVAAVLVAIYRRRLWGRKRSGERDAVGRVLAFFPFVAAVAAQVVKGTYDTAVVVLGIKKTTPGIVRIPVGDRSAVGAAVTAWAATLSPGAALIDADLENREMLFHVIDAEKPDRFRDQQRRFYDKYQKKVFP